MMVDMIAYLRENLRRYQQQKLEIEPSNDILLHSVAGILYRIAAMRNYFHTAHFEFFLVIRKFACVCESMLYWPSSHSRDSQFTKMDVAKNIYPLRISQSFFFPFRSSYDYYLLSSRFGSSRCIDLQ